MSRSDSVLFHLYAKTLARKKPASLKGRRELRMRSLLALQKLMEYIADVEKNYSCTQDDYSDNNNH